MRRMFWLGHHAFSFIYLFIYIIKYDNIMKKHRMVPIYLQIQERKEMKWASSSYNEQPNGAEL